MIMGIEKISKIKKGQTKKISLDKVDRENENYKNCFGIWRTGITDCDSVQSEDRYWVTIEISEISYIRSSSNNFDNDISCKDIFTVGEESNLIMSTYLFAKKQIKEGDVISGEVEYGVDLISVEKEGLKLSRLQKAYYLIIRLRNFLNFLFF